MLHTFVDEKKGVQKLPKSADWESCRWETSKIKARAPAFSIAPVEVIQIGESGNLVIFYIPSRAARLEEGSIASCLNR